MEDIYLMAHRANTIPFFNAAIGSGFNAIEFDVVYHNGQFYAWHGEDSAGKERLDRYLDHMARTFLQDDNRLVSLIIVDLKYDTRSCLTRARIRDVMEQVRTRVLDLVNNSEGASPQRGLFALYTTVFTDQKDARLLAAFDEDEDFGPHEGVNLDADAWPSFFGKNAVARRGWGTGFVNKAMAWRNTNTINNLMLSSGVASGAVGMRRWRDVLAAAQDIRHTQAFGTYAWTFHRARGGVNKMLSYELEGVLGNANGRFGRIPRDLGGYNLDDHRLVTRAMTPPFKRLRDA